MTPDLDRGLQRTVNLLLAWKKRKTNVSQAVRMALKKTIYIREARTEASNLSMTER